MGSSLYLNLYIHFIFFFYFNFYKIAYIFLILIIYISNVFQTTLVVCFYLIKSLSFVLSRHSKLSEVSIFKEFIVGGSVSFYLSKHVSV